MKNILTIILLFALFSCEKTIPIEIDNEEPRPVVNGMFENGKPLKVELSNSVLVGNEGDIGNLENIDIELFTNDTFQEQLIYESDGNYYSSNAMEAGNNYRIEFNALNKNISASSYLPDSVPIVRIDSIVPTTISVDQFGAIESALGITFTFDDLPGNHYYLIDIAIISDIQQTTTDRVWLFYYETDYMGLNTGVGNNAEFNVWEYLRFPDEEFNNSQKTYKFGIVYEEYDVDEWVEQNARFELYFYALDPDLYLYLQTRTVFWNTNEDFFAESANIHTNINGGLGIFAGATLVKKEIDLLGAIGKE